MNSWSVQDAAARCSEFLETCVKDGPQIATNRGADAAVLVPLGENFQTAHSHSIISCISNPLSPLV